MHDSTSLPDSVDCDTCMQLRLSNMAESGAGRRMGAKPAALKNLSSPVQRRAWFCNLAESGASRRMGAGPAVLKTHGSPVQRRARFE